jgi:cytochrome c oxidase subunit 2|tara:strand:+ start:1089 stop:1718 length:630 start_codon:yes stop_codon:yes gene_type:complete
MTKKLVQGVVFAIVLTGMQTAMAAGEPERGKQLFQVCGACHGLAGEGNSILSAPINAGQDEWYVVRQIKNFQAGIRGADPKDIFGMQMRPMAATLVDDQAIQDVAAYVTSLSPPKPPLSIEGDIEAGKKAYVPCAPCHGENAEGSKSLDAPKLAYQFDWYLVRQLQNFKAGIRGSHTKDIYGSQMKPMAQMLATDAQVNDVAAFIASLE